jgi:hypothetical protein
MKREAVSIIGIAVLLAALLVGVSWGLWSLPDTLGVVGLPYWTGMIAFFVWGFRNRIERILGVQLPPTQAKQTKITIDDAKDIAVRHVLKSHRDIKDLSISAEFRSGKWIVEVSWPVEKDKIARTQCVDITISESGKVLSVGVG